METPPRATREEKDLIMDLAVNSQMSDREIAKTLNKPMWTIRTARRSTAIGPPYKNLSAEERELALDLITRLKMNDREAGELIGRPRHVIGNLRRSIGMKGNSKNILPPLDPDHGRPMLDHYPEFTQITRGVRRYYPDSLHGTDRLATLNEMRMILNSHALNHREKKVVEMWMGGCTFTEIGKVFRVGSASASLMFRQSRRKLRLELEWRDESNERIRRTGRKIRDLSEEEKRFRQEAIEKKIEELRQEETDQQVENMLKRWREEKEEETGTPNQSKAGAVLRKIVKLAREMREPTQDSEAPPAPPVNPAASPARPPVFEDPENNAANSVRRAKKMFSNIRLIDLTDKQIKAALAIGIKWPMEEIVEYFDSEHARVALILDSGGLFQFSEIQKPELPDLEGSVREYAKQYAREARVDPVPHPRDNDRPEPKEVDHQPEISVSTTRSVLRDTGASESLLRSWIRRGLLSPTKIEGNLFIWPQEEIDRVRDLVESHRLLHGGEG